MHMHCMLHKELALRTPPSYRAWTSAPLACSLPGYSLHCCGGHEQSAACFCSSLRPAWAPAHAAWGMAHGASFH